MKRNCLIVTVVLMLLTGFICGCGKTVLVTQTDILTVSGTTTTQNITGPTVTYTQTTTVSSAPTTVIVTQTTTVTQTTNTSTSVGTIYKQLGTPLLISPQDGQVFSNYPRTTTLTWQPVTGATKYMIETRYYQGITYGWSTPYQHITTDTSYTFGFVGMQPGCWRVQAVDDSGAYLASNYSEWRTFRYIV